jgi:ABC-2 type transport system ATP-binding protein
VHPVSVVSLEQVSKSYAGKIAVRDLSLSIEPGTMFGLLGPNGAGKTSTIRMIVGITLPDRGTIRLFDTPFARASLGRVGYLPEERGLYRKMKVIDQLIFIGQLHKLNAKEAKRRAWHWAERMAIVESLEKKTQELSKGMQQKIQFIATLLHEPSFLIMDEPFAGLDPINAKLLEDVLRELKRSGCGILFSTHRMDQVEKMCDAICLVNQGEAVLAGSVREIKQRFPRNRVLLDFSGDASFLQSGELKHLIEAARLEIFRYELEEPSLEEIFIQTVGGHHEITETIDA